MAASKEQILESISNMTIMEVVDLVKMMEEKFGVTAAAPVAVAAAAAGGAAAPAAEEQTEFTVDPEGVPGREEGHRHQGDPRDHRPRPQGSEGPGRGRALDRQGRRLEGGLREVQEAARRRRRQVEVK